MDTWLIIKGEGVELLTKVGYYCSMVMAQTDDLVTGIRL